MNHRRALCWLLYVICGLTTTAQTEYRVGAEATVSSGEHEPLWLNANKYGLSSLTKSNGYLRAGLFSDVASDTAHVIRWGYGVDAAVATGFTSTLVVQQAYVEAQWKRVLLTAGSKEWPMELKNQELSSGSQAFGINARPIPQLRLGFDDYVAIPGTRGWLSVKGFCAYGKTTDDSWQKDFTQQQHRYTEDALFHSKAAYLRFGRRHVTFELGMEVGCQFSGVTHLEADGQLMRYKNRNGVKSFFNALVAGGSDFTDDGYDNTEGNHVGSWNMRLNIDEPSWQLGLYADQMFEDNSMMVHIAYNGWGERETAKQHTRSRYFVYDFKDGLLGAELRLKQATWLHTVVVEYLHTMYQGGPVYHDITYNIGEHITGRDNYYNHNIYTGWQHWGQVMGNPLYLSPLYNDDHAIEVYNNRFRAWHLGLAGDPLPCLHYRLLGTYQKGYGSYNNIYPDPRQGLSFLAEASYRFPVKSRLNGWSLRGAVGLDRGELRGDNVGLQLSVAKTGWLGKGKKN